ncbi:hypothetical protein AB0L34_22025 [Micromonospora sp. NPDC052213]|uniref:hypothetical protein n=1 Tax=Micromonospora sp. NPDC052213 TaxID=3155812 RepID=UPI00343BB15C
MTNRSLPAVAVLVIAAALTAACGDDAEEPPRAAPPAASASTPAADVPSGPTAPGTATTATTPAAPPTGAGPAGPSAGTTERRPASPPPVELPARPTGTPGARQVVDAFKAAGLKVPNPRDRSVDCGPDGLGLGCSELIATDAVTVYVFPDESSASDIAETWGGQSFRRGTVVLNYLEARTPKADRPGYEKVLTGLR